MALIRTGGGSAVAYNVEFLQTLNATGSASPSMEAINNVAVGDIIVVAGSISNMEPAQDQTRFIADSTGLEFIDFARSATSGSASVCITYRVSAANPTAKTGVYVGAALFRLT